MSRRRYLGTVPGSGPLRTWLDRLAKMVGADPIHIDPDEIADRVAALLDRANSRYCSDCGHPLVEHDDITTPLGERHGCRWVDNRRGGALCNCDRTFPDAEIPDADDRDAAVGLPMKLATAQEVARHVAMGIPRDGALIGRAIVTLGRAVADYEARDATVAAVDTPDEVDAPVGPVVHLAHAYMVDGSGDTMIGVASTQPGAYAMIGAHAVSEVAGWSYEVVSFPLDDPTALTS